MALPFFNRGGRNPERAEMSFIDHLEALRGHLFRSVIAIAAGAIIVGIYNKFFVQKVLLGPTHADFPTYGVICRIGKALNLEKALCMQGLGIKMQSTSVAGQFSTWFSVVLIGGLIVAFPYVFWEFWKFIRPALSKKELSKTRGVVFWVSLLFFYGCFLWLFCDCPLYP